MRAFLRHLFLLVLSAVVSWRVFLYQPESQGPAPPPPIPVTLALTPRVEAEPPSDTKQEQDPVAAAKPQAPSPPPPPLPRSTSPPQKAEDSSAAEQADSSGPSAPPPPEAGTPEGKENGDAAPVGTDEDPGDLVPIADSHSAMEDPALLAAAAKELSGETRKGFSTVFLAMPEEQLEIGRYFGETLVLVPKAALDPQNPTPYYFQVSLEGTPAVQRVSSRPPLKEFRQYRDFFSYPYDKLPKVLRELRRSVLARNEILLFGALLPPREWALAIDRRRRALASTGHSSSEVRQFVLRYTRSPAGGYDFQVDSIRLANGVSIEPRMTTLEQHP